MVIVSSFANGVNGPFMFDDSRAIVHNPTIHHASLWQILTVYDERPTSARPLSNLSFAIDRKLFGLNPKPYHWENIIIQVIIAGLLFVLMRAILKICLPTVHLNTMRRDWLAAGMSLLWAIHPVQTECVLYITQRSEQFAMLSMVLGFYSLVKCQYHRRWLTVGFLCCFLGMFTKQTVLVLPLMLLLFDRAFIAGSFKACWSQRRLFYIACFAVCISYASLLMAVPSNPLSVGTHLGVSRMDYLLTQSQVITWYLRNLFWPTGICLYYNWPIVTDTADAMPTFMLIASLLAVSLLSLWKWPKLGTWLTGMFIVLGPTSSILPIVSEVASDRRVSLIIPLILFPAVVLLIRGLLRVTRRPQLAMGSVMILLLAAGMFYVNQTSRLSVYYSNPIALWQHQTQQSPWPAGAWQMLGEHLEDEKQLAGAWQCYQQVLQLEPGWNMAQMGLGTVYIKLGRHDQAMKILASQTDHPLLAGVPYNAMGNIHKQKGELKEAALAYDKALEHDPDNLDYRLNRARVHNQLAQYQQALQMLMPYADYPDAPANLLAEAGFACSQRNQLDQAQAYYQRVLKQTPDDAIVLNSIGVVMAKMGKLAEATAYFARAVSIDPQLEEAKDNLQKARQQIQ